MLKIVERHARGIQIPVCYFFYVSEKWNRTLEFHLITGFLAHCFSSMH